MLVSCQNRVCSIQAHALEWLSKSFDAALTGPMRSFCAFATALRIVPANKPASPRRSIRPTHLPPRVKLLDGALYLAVVCNTS